MQKKKTLVESIKRKPEGNFAIINGSQESSHLYPKHELRDGRHLVDDGQYYNKFKGQYSINAGVICFIDKDGFIWIGKYSENVDKKIEEAGYKKGYFNVPHSNDGGYWMRENFQRQLLQTELYNKKRISVEDLKNIFNTRVVHTLRVSNLDKGGINADENLPRTIEAMLQRIEDQKDIVLSASTIPIDQKANSNNKLFWGGYNYPFGVIAEEGTVTEFNHIGDASTYPEGRNLSLTKPEHAIEGASVGKHVQLRTKQIYSGGYDEVSVNIKKYSCFFQLPYSLQINQKFHSIDILNSTYIFDEIYKLNEQARLRNVKMFIFEDGIFREVIFQNRHFNLDDVGNNCLYFDDINFNPSGIKKETVIRFMQYQAQKEEKRLLLASENSSRSPSNSLKKSLNVLLPFYKE